MRRLCVARCVPSPWLAFRGSSLRCVMMAPRAMPSSATVARRCRDSACHRRAHGSARPSHSFTSCAAISRARRWSASERVASAMPMLRPAPPSEGRRQASMKPRSSMNETSAQRGVARGVALCGTGLRQGVVVDVEVLWREVCEPAAHSRIPLNKLTTPLGAVCGCGFHRPAAEHGAALIPARSAPIVAA